MPGAYVHQVAGHSEPDEPTPDEIVKRVKDAAEEEAPALIETPIKKKDK